MRSSLPLLGAALLAVPSAAAADGALTLYVDGGLTLPADPPEFAELWNAGPDAGVAVGIRLSPEWELVGSFRTAWFPADDEAQAADLLLVGFGQSSSVEKIDGRDATVRTVMAEARFHVPTEGGRLDPFLSFGWGYFEIFTSEATVIPTAPDLRPVVVLGDTDGAFGVAAGGGMAWAAWPRVSLLANVSYTIGFTESISTQYFPVRVGLGVGF